MKPANVCDYLLEGKRPEKAALLMERGQFTYGELRSLAHSYAERLLMQGGLKGDRAVLCADSGPFWAAAYLGTLRAGLVSVPIASKSTTADLDYILKTTEAAFVFAEGRYASRFNAVLPPERIIVPEENSNHLDYAADTISIRSRAGDRDLAALMFTSGSTGKPRGVMITHANIIANTESIIEYLNLTADDRIMAVLPFHYCFGASLLHTHLRVGGSVVVDSRFMYPEKVLQRMVETECTGFAGVPSHYQILLRRSHFPSMRFPKLRYVQQAGGPLAPAFIRELRDALPGKKIFVMYGQTEATARLSYLPPEFLDTKLGSVGKGIAGVQLSLLDEQGSSVKSGQVGQIVAEGENVAAGYWRDKEETAKSFKGGKLFTGDLATVDEDGFIFIVDRAKDFLKCGGKRVSCRSLENLILEHSSVLEAAVVGVPDETLGEAAVAYVVPRDPKVDPSPDLNSHCRRHMPLSFVPRRFVMVKTLPKNSAGKVLKPLLKLALATG